MQERISQNLIYDKWNTLKKELNIKKHTYCKPRQVWWCNTGENIGSEQNGKGPEFLRPVIVIKVFSQKYFLGIPETSKKREGTYFFEIKHGDKKELSSFALLNQARVYSTRRLKKRIAIVDTPVFKQLQESLAKVLDLQVNTPLKAGSKPQKR